MHVAAMYKFVAKASAFQGQVSSRWDEVSEGYTCQTLGSRSLGWDRKLPNLT